MVPSDNCRRLPWPPCRAVAGKERKYLLPPQLLAEQNCSRCISSVNLEDTRRQIHSNRVNLSHGRLPQVVFKTFTLAHQGRWGATPSEPGCHAAS